MVVLKTDNVDVLAIRAGDLELSGLRKSVVEVLDLGVELLGEAGLDALEDVIRGGLVPREAEGTVSAVIAGDLVEIPQVSLKPVLDRSS